MIIWPVLSPEINDLTSFRRHKADTEPAWPQTAFVHLLSYQKYIDPLAIPLNIYFFYWVSKGNRHNDGEFEKLLNYPLVTFNVVLSKLTKRSYFNVAATKDF